MKKQLDQEKHLCPDALDLKKFQGIVDMLCEIYESSTGAIVEYQDNSFKVRATSVNEDNFLSKDSEWSSDIPSFCRSIMQSKEMLYIPTAIDSELGSQIDAVINGPVRSYLGYPIFWPDNSYYGSICVIDTKPTNYSSTFIKLLGQFKDLVESELKHYVDFKEISQYAKQEIQLLSQKEQIISKQASTEKALALQESINFAAFSSLIESVIRINQQGQILSANPATFSLFGYKEQELIGQNVKILMEGEHSKHHDQYIKNYLETGVKKVIGLGRQVQGRKQNGTSFPAHLSVTELKIDDETQFIGVIHDVSKYEEQKQKLESLAWFDPLTNCRSRAYLWDRITRNVSRSGRSKQPFFIIYIDLDKFKPINDQYGHNAGDHVLKVLSERVLNSIRLEDTLSRVGGDEFVILFENEINTEEIIRKIKQEIEMPINYQDISIELTASFGSAKYPDDGQEVDQLIDIADKRMYSEKKRYSK